MTAVGAVSLRLLAGMVSKKTMDQLKRTVEQAAAEYPWQVVTQAVLAETVDEQKLVQQGVRAHRDWILRGGRTDPGAPLGVKAKTLLAKVLAQLIFFTVYTAVVCLGLLIAKYLWNFDLYVALTWVQTNFPTLLPKR